MRKVIRFFNTINARILLVLLVLFIVIAGVVGVVNSKNIQTLYENSYTERLLLTNALMGSIVHSEDIAYFVDLMRGQSDIFKARQVDFYHDREMLFALQEAGAPQTEQQAVMARLAAFHAETQKLKNQAYWDILAELKELKAVSRSTYVYVMADTGLFTRDGEPLYTYIFDAEDEGAYSSPDMDGLGTSDIGNEAFTNVFLTKKQTEQAEHYEGDFGELYFVCVPILDDSGEVIAILGTDLSLDDMHSAIAASTALFNNIIISILVVSVVVIFILLSRTIARPLSSLTETALVFAEGNLHTSISQAALRQRTEIGTLAQAFKSTLDATTLYLNSVPEGLFIMNRKQETLFRNEQFISRFGDMQARDFVRVLFPDGAEREMERALGAPTHTRTVWIEDACFAVMLKEIVLAGMPENSILVIANDITDLMREKENAQAAAAAKSDFLSRMSHEMRTPMNAIIGMAKVAGGLESIPGIKHCVTTINNASVQLLSIINDVLDMSKIEAGKFEIEKAPMNIEKTLMNACCVVMDGIEKKRQKLSVVLSKNLALGYIADDLRLSQVLTNLLSNAVKFTPEGGSITLTVESDGPKNGRDTLRFSVSDTGIGMSEAQLARLFNAFEQADGSIARKYGGTGLGLAISQNIVEMMGGRITAQSRPNEGATFRFALTLECAPEPAGPPFGGVRAADIRLLVVESDGDAQQHIVRIARELGVEADTAGTANAAIALLDVAAVSGRPYDVIFLDDGLPDAGGLAAIGRRGGDAVVMTTTYQRWRRVQQEASENGVGLYIAKPIFPASVRGAIGDVLRRRLDVRETPDAQDDTPDLAGVRVLLAEDIEINREVFLALMDGTGLEADMAENGRQAVEMFRANPERYHLIFMDIQMPEMDGYQATRAIRALDLPQAKTVPIVAMSANAFKEDIDRCLACGMNDHLAKPLDLAAVFQKTDYYVGLSG